MGDFLESFCVMKTKILKERPKSQFIGLNEASKQRSFGRALNVTLRFYFVDPSKSRHCTKEEAKSQVHHS